ncbi:MAG: phytanoyl-CoA dioxygenase family protein [Planctomycetota bacterium]|nr:phytanoyl-CoA dioxygenase family protein [Planctomycetota bacterium]
MSGTSRRTGDFYRVTPEEVEHFRGEGYVHLRGLLAEEELAELDAIYARFLAQEIEVQGKDFCDMAGDYRRAAKDFAVVNVMLPRRYHPPLRGNVYERRAASVAEQLCGPDMVLDYDQLVAKTPRREDAVFEWHQDLVYWPVTPDPRTASFWLALDHATVENGCLHFVPGSHLEPRLRAHRPVLGDRGDSHTLRADVDPDRDELRPVPITRGDVTVHHERTIHGSPGNRTAGWRRAYIVAFRTRKTVAAERKLGFTHSHNDAPDVLDTVGREDASATT